MNCRFNWILSGLVPVLGLVSCTASKNADQAPAVVFINDDWKLPDLVASNPRDKTQARKILGAKAEPLDADSELVFADSETNNYRDIRFSWTATCRSDSENHETHLQTKGTPRIPVAGLIPFNFFFRLNWNGLGDIHCTLQGTATNKIGSTRQVATEFRVRGLANLEALQLKIGGTDLAEALNRKTALNGYPINVLDGFNVTLAKDLQWSSPAGGISKSQWDLVCDHFSNSRQLDSNASQALIFDQLFNGEISSGSQFNKGYDPRISFGQQKCRILVRTVDPETGSLSLFASPIFPYTFPAGQIQITIQEGGGFQFVSGHTLALSGQELFKLQITNKSKAPLGFKFPLLKGPVLSLQYLIRLEDITYRSWNMPAEAPWILNGDSRRWVVGDDLVFEILPNTTATITAMISSRYQCDVGHFGFQERDPDRLGYAMGFAYKFTTSVTLKQYLMWNPLDPKLDEAAYVRSEVKINDRETNGQFDGWLPSPGWLAFNGGDRTRPDSAPARFPEIPRCY